MSAVTLDADMRQPGQGWRALLWFVPLTVGWTVLNFAVPAIAASGAPTALARLFIHTLIALGLWLGLERAELTPSQRRNTWLAVMIPFTIWAGVIWGAAINGFFRPGLSPIPLLPTAIFVPVIVGVPLVLRSKRLGQVLDAMPPTWLVALQAYRVLGAGFLIGWARNVVPSLFALPAGIGDVLTGLAAVAVATSLASGTLNARRTAVFWNIFGLLDFAVAITLGQVVAYQLIATGIPNATIGTYPTVMIPAFAVPSSILLHVLSLRQLRRRG